MPFPAPDIIDRRSALKLAAGALALGGCAGRRGPRAVEAPRTNRTVRPLARVTVSPERVVRTRVGLRPFRPSGFVVRPEPVGDKLVIHHYGHGGAGITLSWGTARLALEEFARTDHAGAVAVIGCGAVGLSTARLLQQQAARGFLKEVRPARDIASRLRR